MTRALTSKDLKEIEQIMKKLYPHIDIEWVFEKKDEKPKKI